MTCAVSVIAVTNIQKIASFGGQKRNCDAMIPTSKPAVTPEMVTKIPLQQKIAELEARVSAVEKELRTNRRCDIPSMSDFWDFAREFFGLRRKA